MLLLKKVTPIFFRECFEKVMAKPVKASMAEAIHGHKAKKLDPARQYEKFAAHEILP